MSLSYALLRLKIKEFADVAQTGFGIDGNEETKRSDLTAVRGTLEKDSFV